jgi:hypothetical protein
MFATPATPQKLTMLSSSPSRLERGAEAAPIVADQTTCAPTLTVINVEWLGQRQL